jgi:hypothetical protein
MKVQSLCFALVAAGWVTLSPYAFAATPDQSTNDVAMTSPEARDNWSFDVVPYLWLAGADGTFSVPDAPAGMRTRSVDSFATHISGAAMLAGEIRYRDVGLHLEGAWLQLRTEGGSSSGLYSGTDIRTDIAFGTVAGMYRLVDCEKLKADLLGGARIWYGGIKIHFEPGTAPGLTADGSRTWCDPIIGASLHYDLSKHCFGIVLGDAGGFGVGSDLEWNVFGGVGYRFASWSSVTLGYRYMHVDYSHEGFVMNANVQGLLLGFGFHF